jgi:hypothetical protein
VTDITTVTGSKTIPAGLFSEVHVDCPDDHPIVTGGGGSWSANTPTLSASFPNGNGWTVDYTAQPDAAARVTVYALCATP